MLEADDTPSSLKEVAHEQSHEMLILRSLLEGANAMCADKGENNIQMVLDVALERLDTIHTAFQAHI